MAEQHFASDNTLTDFAIKRGIVDASKLEPIGDMIGDALGNIVSDSSSTTCTNRPSCPCPKCQTKLRQLARKHLIHAENQRSPLNRAQRRAAKKLRKRR